MQSRIVEGTERADFGDYKNFVSIRPILDKISSEFQRSFADACAKSILSSIEAEDFKKKDGSLYYWTEPIGSRIRDWGESYNLYFDVYIRSTYEIFQVFKHYQQNVPAYTRATGATVRVLAHILQIHPYHPTQQEYLGNIVEAIASTSPHLLEDLAMCMLPNHHSHRPNGIPYMWMSSLPRITEIAKKHPAALKYCHIIVNAMLFMFLSIDIEREAIPLNTLQRGTVSCTCTICEQLNKFLQSLMEDHFNDLDQNWGIEGRKHARAELKNVVNASDELEFGIRNELTQDRPAFLSVSKIDRKFKKALQSREKNIKQYRGVLGRILEIRKDEDAATILGDMSKTLLTVDIDACVSLLDDLQEHSLGSICFESLDSIDMDTRRENERIIEARGGRIIGPDNRLDTQDARPSTRHTPASKQVLIMSGEPKPGDLEQARAHYISEMATAIPTEVNMQNLQRFVDYIWYDRLVERLNIPEPKSVSTPGTKRKLSDIANRPFADITHQYDNPYSVAPRLNQPVHNKSRKIHHSSTPTRSSDKENEPEPQFLEVVDLT